MTPEEAIKYISDLRPTNKLRGHSFSIPSDDEIKQHGANVNEALDSAIKALEKQIAKRPKGISLTHDGRAGNCPNSECNKLVWERSVQGNSCPECLQRLGWR